MPDKSNAIAAAIAAGEFLAQATERLHAAARDFHDAIAFHPTDYNKRIVAMTAKQAAGTNAQSAVVNFRKCAAMVYEDSANV